jgi:hypothetical protein
MDIILDLSAYSRRLGDRACGRKVNCVDIGDFFPRALVKYMQRVLVAEQSLCGDSLLQATATTVRYTRCTLRLWSLFGQHSMFSVKSCLFRAFPLEKPIVKPNSIPVNTDGIRIASMGRSFRFSLAKKHILGASIVCQEAGIKARLQKGLIQLYLGEWSCALIFATHTTNSAESGASRPSPGSLLSGERS